MKKTVNSVEMWRGQNSLSLDLRSFIQIGLANSEEIEAWAERSYLIAGNYVLIGEVKKADTINYRTFKPEKDGLFCERIFGPVKDWVCSCGQSRRMTQFNQKSNSKEQGKQNNLLKGPPTPETGDKVTRIGDGVSNEESLVDSGKQESKNRFLSEIKVSSSLVPSPIMHLFDSKNAKAPSNTFSYKNGGALLDSGWGPPWGGPGGQDSLNEEIKNSVYSSSTLQLPAGNLSKSGEEFGINNPSFLFPTGYYPSTTLENIQGVSRPHSLFNKLSGGDRGQGTSKMSTTLAREKQIPRSGTPILRFFRSLGRLSDSGASEKESHLPPTTLLKKPPPAPRSGGGPLQGGTWGGPPRRGAPEVGGAPHPVVGGTPPAWGAPHQGGREKLLQERNLFFETIPQTGPLLCSNCQVEVTLSRIRRYRMGYIRLGCPVTHIWFLNSRPNIFATLFKMPTKYVKKITYYKGYTVSNSQYLNPCLSPGGDFFDNEWDFVHRWLGGIEVKNTNTLVTKSHEVTGGPGGPSLDGGPPHGVGGPPPGGPGVRDKVTYPQLTRHLPEYPFWLENTGAKALQQLFEEKNWKMEYERLAETLRKTPFLETGMLASTSASARLVSSLKTKKTKQRLINSLVLDLRETEIKYLLKQRKKRVRTLKLLNLLRTAGGILPELNSLNILYSTTLVKKPPGFETKSLGSGGPGIRDFVSVQTPPPTTKLCSFILTSIPVLPPELRPIVQLNAGQLASSDVNDLYRRLISRNNRLNYYLSGGANKYSPTSPARIQSNPEPKHGSLENQSAPQESFNIVGGGEWVPLGVTTPLLNKKEWVDPLNTTGDFSQPPWPPDRGAVGGSPAGETPQGVNLKDLVEAATTHQGDLIGFEKTNQVSVKSPGSQQKTKTKIKTTGSRPHLVEFLVRSEQHLVQLAVDALLENGKTTSVRHKSGRDGKMQGRTNQASSSNSSNQDLYKSLSDRIGGKQGRFRQNLLGKRVDYSGRSVIIVGPKNLALHQCGLPYEIAEELFQPFLIRHILELQLAKTIRGAKTLIQSNKPLSHQLLENIVQSHPILLNRAPTLHRLGIQAFQPKLVKGRGVQLHPLVCTAFNADFDGDQMAIHVPLSPKARIEARLLMLANTNWLSSATGQPSILPSQDMILGFYYLTIEKPPIAIPQSIFSNAPQSSFNINSPPSGSQAGGRDAVTQEILPNSDSGQSCPLPFFNKECGPSHSIFDLGFLSALNGFNSVIQAYEQKKLSLHSFVWVKPDSGTGSGDSISSNLQELGQEMGTGDAWDSTKALLRNRKLTKYFQDSNTLPGGYTFTQPPPYRKIKQAFSGKSEFSKNLLDEKVFYFKPNARGGNPDEPLAIRLIQTGQAKKLYTSSQWIESTQGTRRFIQIRTTPGRILVNQLLSVFLGPV
jgi:DNA-directed RNA polymerase beta' subunit